MASETASSDQVWSIVEEALAEGGQRRRRGLTVPVPLRPRPAGRRPLYAIDMVLASESGGLLVVGWVEDIEARLEAISLSGEGWSCTFEFEAIGRLKRADVDAALGAKTEHLRGFWGLCFLDGPRLVPDRCVIELRLGDGLADWTMHPLRRGSEDEIRRVVANLLDCPVADLLNHAAAAPAAAALARLAQERRNHLVITATEGGEAATRPVPSHNIELIAVSDSGGVFVIGWIRDDSEPLDCLRISGSGWRVVFDQNALVRVYREDVRNALGLERKQSFGFWGFLAGGQPVPERSDCAVEFVMARGARQLLRAGVRVLEDAEMRALVLSYLASSAFLGNAQAEAIASLDRFAGEQIIAFNHRLSQAMVRSPYVERFPPGGGAGQTEGSIVVCLYGRPEYFFLQNALFAGGPGIGTYEFVYVCNSPELAEMLVKEARINALAYGLRQTLVLLAGNAGFGAANNAAVAHCQSGRVLFVNPDVFPREEDWAARHSAIVADLPAERTRLFGARLYYDDGSLMHGGMFFEQDSGLVLDQGAIRQQPLLRVEHYGKGAPPSALRFIRSRPVPAISGAFISCERSWFEALGGFSEDYVLGHYEDADLCLASLAKGIAPWINELELWHLEGKGSIRLPVHEGASTVNRWLFSRRWASRIGADLLGPEPSHPLLCPAAPLPEKPPATPDARKAATSGHRARPARKAVTRVLQRQDARP